MLKKHEKLGVEVEINENFTQAQYEQYQELLIEKGDQFRSVAAKSRVLIEAAQESKIVESINGDTDKPSIVLWLTKQVLAAVDAALEIPKE
jgi:hypothetical protein